MLGRRATPWAIARLAPLLVRLAVLEVPQYTCRLSCGTVGAWCSSRKSTLVGLNHVWCGLEGREISAFDIQAKEDIISDRQLVIAA
jgi:hypothetical protein